MTTLLYANRSGRTGRDLLWLLVSRREYCLAILLALIVAVVGARNHDFLTLQNFRDMLTNAAQTAVISCGVMLVIITGEIDISVGSAMGLLTAFMGTMLAPADAIIPGWGWPVWLGILLTLAAGALIGLVNGLLVTLARIPSIIVTLAMLMALRSLTAMIMHRGDLDVPPGLHETLGVGRFFTIPAPVWVMAAVLLFSWALVRYTPIGRRIYAVGSNTAAAALSGLSVTRIKIFTFAFTGLLVGVATVITQLAKLNSTIGQDRELLVITCIVVGGISINGGQGTVLGMFLGVLLLESQKTFLIFLNLGQGVSKWDKAIQGALILAAVLVDHVTSRHKSHGGGGP